MFRARRSPPREEGGDYVLVAAIDLGTAFSGYAFSTRPTASETNLHENIRVNKSWGENLGFQSYKAPTSVLTDQWGKFIAFGYEAEEQFSKAQGDTGPSELLLFRHFKMVLHKHKSIKEKAVVSAVDGTLMPAREIFAQALRYLKTHMLRAIQLDTGSLPEAALIRWVVTVPAIWSEESKAFMRTAAHMAGLIAERHSRNLLLALEPEAASLYCRRLQPATQHGPAFPAKTKYLVLDCGGGTVDITAHITESSGCVRELLHASGGDWGGTKVDKKFMKFMEKILGKDFLNKFRQKCPREFLKFQIEFEKVKKTFSADENRKLCLTLPYALGETYRHETGKTIDKAFRSVEGVDFRSGSITIKHEVAARFFASACKKTIAHVRDIIRSNKLSGLRYIMMVGGFSESAYLQHEVKAAFQSQRLTVLVPSEAQLAIIKGAVLFGHNPTEIRERVASRTYGCGVKVPYSVFKHEKHRKVRDPDGKDRCDNVFDVLVAKGQSVATGNHVERCYDSALHDSITCRLFATDAAGGVKYTDVPGVEEIGSVSLLDLGTDSDKQIKLLLKFGDTEMQVEATDVATGRRVHTLIDFSG